MFDFIRQNWKAYLIGFGIAVLLGYGVAIFVGVKGSTPTAVREARISSERSQLISQNALADAQNASNDTGDEQTGEGEGEAAGETAEGESASAEAAPSEDAAAGGEGTSSE